MCVDDSSLGDLQIKNNIILKNVIVDVIEIFTITQLKVRGWIINKFSKAQLFCSNN